MKKVLIIGPEYYDYYLSVEKAFRNLGFLTKVISSFKSEVSTAKDKIAYHLSRNKNAFFDDTRNRFNESVSRLYAEFEPDLVFIIQADEVYPETVEKMNKSRRVLWMMDSIFRKERGFGLRNIVDDIFLFEKTDIPKLWSQERIKASFLPLALDEAVYFPTLKDENIDILFIGTLYPNRLELLESMCEKFKKYRIRIYGYYYSPLRRPFYHLFRKNKDVFLNKNIPPAVVNQLYNQSKICLNIHHTQAKHGVNQRFFEISGSKAFQLVDSNQYISENFSDEEIVTYTSTNDLFDKIDLVLRNEIDYRSIASRAYDKVISQHTFTQRMKEVLEMLGVQLPMPA